MEYCSAIKMNKLMPFAATWMELETDIRMPFAATWIEVQTQKEKDKYHTASLTSGP